LDEAYDPDDETNYKRTPIWLHGFTTHSPRHYAITNFTKQTNGNVILTAKFARHRGTQVMLTYINTTKQDLYEEIDRIFSIEQAERINLTNVQLTDYRVVLPTDVRSTASTVRVTIVFSDGKSK
jgi:hypothetical protein